MNVAANIQYNFVKTRFGDSVKILPRLFKIMLLFGGNNIILS